MKNRNIQWIMAALLLMGGMTILSSCSSDDDDNSNSQANTETEEATWQEPTDDQMEVSVTYDLPTASLSQFAEPSTGAALLKRLSFVTASIQQNTELVLIKGSDVSSQSDQVIGEMARVMLYDGYVALETPTQQQLDLFMDKIIKDIAAIVSDSINKIFYLTPEQLQASVKASLAGRMETRRANLAPYTRAAAAGADDVCAEMVIFSSDDFFYQDPIGDTDKVITYATDTEGNIVEPEQTITFTPTVNTAYQHGRCADGIAQWLNNMEAEQAAEEQQAAQSPSRRADGSKAINDIQNASESFTHHTDLKFKTLENNMTYKSNACQTILRCWGVHNMANGKDYYYISQQVVLSMGDNKSAKLFFSRGMAEDKWCTTKEYKNFTLAYGNYLSKYETSMDLTGEGLIKGEAATPETANQTTTESINLTTSSSTTESGGFNVGVSVGVTMKGITANGTVGVSMSTGQTTGSSFAMGNSKSIKGLSVVKNTAGTKVRWNYTGQQPQATGKDNAWKHDIVADILVNDANLTNDVCWSVENPNGRYKLQVESSPSVGLMLVDPISNIVKVEHTQTTDDPYVHELLMPNRYLQTWRMFLVVNKWGEQGYLPKLQTQLEEGFKTSFKDIYADVFTVAESSENSTLLAAGIISHAMAVFDAHKNVLANLAQDNGVKEFTIYWRCDNTNITLRGGYLVKATDF